MLAKLIKTGNVLERLIGKQLLMILLITYIILENTKAMRFKQGKEFNKVCAVTRQSEQLRPEKDTR